MLPRGGASGGLLDIKIAMPGDCFVQDQWRWRLFHIAQANVNWARMREASGRSLVGLPRTQWVVLCRYSHRQRTDAADEVGVDPLGLADHLDFRETGQDFLPQDLELQFRQAVANAAMDAEAE
jgi:hypothetical protein